MPKSKRSTRRATRFSFVLLLALFGFGLGAAPTATTAASAHIGAQAATHTIATSVSPMCSGDYMPPCPGTPVLLNA